MTSVSTDAGSHKALNSRKMSMVSCTCFPCVFFLRVTHQFHDGFLCVFFLRMTHQFHVQVPDMFSRVCCRHVFCNLLHFQGVFLHRNTQIHYVKRHSEFVCLLDFHASFLGLFWCHIHFSVEPFTRDFRLFFFCCKIHQPVPANKFCCDLIIKSFDETMWLSSHLTPSVKKEGENQMKNREKINGKQRENNEKQRENKV